MKISLRFLYLLPVLGLVFRDRAFTEFVFKDEGSPILGLYGNVLLGVTLLIIGFCYRAMEPLVRRWLLLLLAALGALSLESYAGWQSWFVYPHVFGKLLMLLHMVAMYAFYRRFGLPPLGLLMTILLFGLVTSLLVFHPDALSLSSFLDNERGFGSTEAMLLLLPTLYYLNRYLTHGGLVQLVLFFVGALLIGFLQHRSVWVSMGAALALNGLLLAFGRIEGARLTTVRLLPMALLPFVALLSGGLVILSDPQISRKLERSVQDIMHPAQQGTGSWRLQQFQAYEPFILDYPVAGMRLEGFELPVQFYTTAAHGGGDEQVWENMTGHHFHSFYVDRLFYFGAAGLLLTLLVPVLVLVRRLRQPVPLPAGPASLIIFALSSLVYSISYDWPLYMFGLWGLSLAAAAAPVWRAGRGPVPAAATLVDLVPHPFQPFSVPSNVNAATASSPRA